MNLFKMTVFFLVITNTVFAAIPTPEGLFRNGNNKDINTEMVVIKLKIEEISNDGVLKLEKESQEDLKEVISANSQRTRHYKFIYSNEKDKSVDLIQVQYEDAQMKKESVIKASYFKNLNKKLAENISYEPTLFYSLNLMLTLNNSKGLTGLIKKVNETFKNNKELMNQEKVTLLEKYREYLARAREKTDKTTSVEVSMTKEDLSPLAPMTDDEKKKVKELLDAKMYDTSEIVTLKKIDNKFFWQMKMENIYADFSSESHRLKKLVLNIGDETIEINLSNYILFDGIHELPKTIIYKSLNNKVFKITYLKYQGVMFKGRKMYKRAREYKELESRYNSKRIKKEESKDTGIIAEDIFSMLL
jgi:hypothetical protein